MEIDIIKIIPKNWLIKDLEGKIEVTYNLERGNHNRKAFVLPKTIYMDKRFFEAIGYYLGDGDYNRKDKSHLTITSKDKDLAKLFLDFLRIYFDIKDKDLTLLVQYKSYNKNLTDEWAKFLKISEKKVLRRFSGRHKEEALSIQVNGVVFRKIFELILDKSLTSNFLRNKNLRRAFLRGLFGAEGNIGVDYLEKKPYISQITFSLNIKEVHLKNFVCEILNLEEIDYKIVEDERDNSLEIVIMNWRNYLKMWKIDLFDLCRRKKNKFEKICINLDIYLDFNNKFRNYFFESLDLCQKDIAKIIGSWQANVSRTIKGFHLLKIEQLSKLLKYSRLNKKDISNNIDYFRVGSLTKLEKDEDIFRFLKKYKSF